MGKYINKINGGHLKGSKRAVVHVIKAGGIGGDVGSAVRKGVSHRKHGNLMIIRAVGVKGVAGPRGIGSSDVPVGEGVPAALVGLCEPPDAFSVLANVYRLLRRK